MLKQLRNKKTAKKVWIILALVIVPPFILWGSNSMMRNSSDKSAYIGKLFGRDIPNTEFRDAVQAVRIQTIMQFGDKLPEVEKMFNFESQAWDRLILLYEAQRRRLNASDKEVEELISGYPFFQHNGQFDLKVYDEVLRYVFRMQPRLFEEQTRQNIIINKLYKEVTTSITVTDEEVLQEYRKTNEEISLLYLAANPTDFTKGMKPKDDEIKDYFTKNSLSFKQPISYNIEYASSDSSAKIKTLTQKLNKNSDLKVLAKEAGVEYKETGLFSQADPVPGIGWSPEIIGLLSQLKPGEHSPIISSDKNFYVLMLKEVKEPYIPEFDKIKDKIRDQIIKEGSERSAKEKIETCMKELLETYKKDPKMADFNKAAKTYGLKSDSTASFKFGSYIEGIGASDIFWTQSQGLKEGEFSNIIGMPSGFYIVRIKSHTQIDDKKFAAEKKDFKEKFLSQRQQELFQKFAQELKKKAI